MTRLFSIGHSNNSMDRFATLLKEQDVTVLVDVRTKPFSRFCPQFQRAKMKTWLADHGIQYFFGGAVLGGLAPISVNNPLFAEKLNKVRELSQQAGVAMMCAEVAPSECHRATKLSLWLHQNTADTVKHITPKGLLDGREYEPTIPQKLLWYELHPGGEYGTGKMFPP
jgi:uncharacterized protein (DUF488 family)